MSKPNAYTAEEFGPLTVTRPSLNRVGIGQALQLRGNPFTWLFSKAGECIPVARQRHGGQGNAGAVINLAQGGSLGVQPARYEGTISPLPRGYTI